jgi:hypothetical protein
MGAQKNMKIKVVSLIALILLVALVLPVVAFTDSYVISDEASGLSQLKHYFVASSGNTKEIMALRDEISRLLSDYGYQPAPFSPSRTNLIVVMYNVTNEVKNVDVYTDESQYVLAAETYKMFADTAKTMSPDARDVSKNSLVRRNKAVFPVELVTIYAYVLQNEYSIKKVWEGGAGSVEGTSADLLSLTVKALANFPRAVATGDAQAQ